MSGYTEIKTGVKWKSVAASLNSMFLDIYNRLFRYPPSLSEDITVNVGTGGEYTSINAALDGILTQWSPSTEGYSVTINLVSGFVLKEQVLVDSENLGWIKITSTDSIVTIDRSFVTEAVTSGESTKYPVFSVINGGNLPTIGALFAMNSSGTSTDRVGIMCAGLNSSCNILSGCGVRNTANCGLYVIDGGKAFCQYSDFAYSVMWGIYVINNGCAIADHANVSYSDRGITAQNCSYVSAQLINASHCSTYGAYATQASSLACDGINARYCGTGISASFASMVSASTGNVLSATTYGVDVESGSVLSAASLNADDAGTYGLYVQEGGIINAHGSSGTLSQTENTITNNGIIFR